MTAGVAHASPQASGTIAPSDPSTKATDVHGPVEPARDFETSPAADALQVEVTGPPEVRSLVLTDSDGTVDVLMWRPAPQETARDDGRQAAAAKPAAAVTVSTGEVATAATVRTKAVGDSTPPEPELLEAGTKFTVTVADEAPVVLRLAAAKPGERAGSRPAADNDQATPSVDVPRTDRAGDVGQKPSETTTGVPAGVDLTPSGSITVTRDGAVIDAQHVTGTITVRADDVTIKRTLIENTGRYPIRVDGGTNLTVEDTEIDGRGKGSAAVCCSSYTLRRVNIHHVTEGPRANGGVVIEDSWMHDLVECPGCHEDVIQSTGGTGLLLRGNRLEAGARHNATIMLGEEDKPLRDCLIVENYLDGGQVSVNAGGGGTDGAQCTFAGNEIGDGARYAPTKHLGDGIDWTASNRTTG